MEINIWRKMKKDKRFLLRLSKEDDRALHEVAQAIQRTRSDAFRWALHEVRNALNEQPEKLKLLKQVKRPD
jgi:hypothetical protein